MTKDADYLVPGPPFNTAFSAVDQVTPPIYSRRILIFSRPDVDKAQAILALRNGLRRTVHELPILAGQMGLDPRTGWTIRSPGAAAGARLRVREDVDMSFAELRGSGFDEKMLDADALSSVPGLADPQTEWHACRLQANFIRGGLLLVVSVNHTVMDGYGITKFIESLAKNCRVGEPAASLGSLPTFDRAVLSERDSTNSHDIDRLPAYALVSPGTKLPPVSGNVTTTTFRLSPSSLQALKTDASPPPSPSAAVDWITTHDALNALCWRTHARGRRDAGLICDQDTARFAFPVDFRRLLEPALPETYTGNAVIMTQVSLPVDSLLAPSGLRAAAAAIRAGIRAVDPAYVSNFVAVAKSCLRTRREQQQQQLRISLKLEQPDTGFGSTSYKSFDHSALDWDSVLGRYERLRLAWGVTGEGMSVILPVLGDGSWEVTVTLREELEGRFREDKEWIGYTS